MAILTIVISLACWFHASDLRDLGSDRFAERESATTRLKDSITGHLSCRYIATRTGDPEVRQRAERVIDWHLQNLGKASEASWDEAITALIDHPCEFDGLPWERGWMSVAFRGYPAADAALLRAVGRARREGWLTEDGYLPCEIKIDRQPVGVLSGLSEIRFANRGLPSPTLWSIRHRHSDWSQLKSQWRVQKFLITVSKLF